MIKMTAAALEAFNEWLRNYDGLKDEDQAYDDYREWINELQGDLVYVGSSRWEAAHVLEELDPIAFRCGFSDYTSSQDVHEINIDGKWFYSDKSEEDLLDDFQSDECRCCDVCGQYCLYEEMTSNDPEDGFSEHYCPDCVEHEAESGGAE